MITIRGKQREEETQREENKGQKMIIGELEHILTNTFTPTRSALSHPDILFQQEILRE